VALLVGIVLALGIGLLARASGLDRDRALYPATTIVVASYYSLFAVMGESHHALIVETTVGALFLLAAIVGFKSSLWWVVAALAGHGVFDSFHDKAITNPGLPAFWPPFCAAYDVTAAAFLAWLLKSGRVRAASSTIRNC
jgi:hypothetical protein